MATRRNIESRGNAARRPKERLALLEDCDPLAVSIGTLYAYDMTLSMEAQVKGADELLEGYRKAMDGKYPAEADRKAAIEATKSMLATLAEGKDQVQSEAARRLLEAWEKLSP